jgi:hypothetical protein
MSKENNMVTDKDIKHKVVFFPYQWSTVAEMLESDGMVKVLEHPENFYLEIEGDGDDVHIEIKEF